MIARKIELILTDRQYEALCQSVAKSGRTVASVVQKFVEDLPKDETIIKWLAQYYEKNFLSYLMENEKLELVQSLFEKMAEYQLGIAEACAAGKSKKVAEINDKLETSWKLIREEYYQYRNQNPDAQPLLDEIQRIKDWRL